MKIYLLDWNGTLNTLADPLDFVKTLQARGDKAVLYSGGCFMGDEALYNEVARRCDDVKSKNCSQESLEETISFLSEGDTSQDEVVYAEDNDMLQGIGRHYGWRIVEPQNLLAELD